MWWTHVVRSFILPPGSLLLLGLAGLLLLHRGRRRMGLTLLGGALGMLYVLALPPVALGLMRGLESHPPLASPQAAGAQAIVLLGGGLVETPEYDRPVVNSSTLARTRYAFHLHRKTGLPILAAGGNHETYSEAAAMWDVLQELGVREVWLEERSRTTWENALYSQPMLAERGIRRILLVTSAQHMGRSVSSFEKVGLEVVPAPMGFATEGPWDGGILAIVPQGRCLAGSQAALEEWLGRLWYGLRYRATGAAGE